MMRGTRSRYFASIRVTHKSAGSLACESVETMKYLFGSPARAVLVHPVWPGVSRRHKFGALISVCRDWLMDFSVLLIVTGSYRRVGSLSSTGHGMDRGGPERYVVVPVA